MIKLFRLLSVLCVVAVSCGRPVKETAISILANAASSGKILLAHQDDLMYGHDWNANENLGLDSLTRSDVFSVTGSYPYILGLDLGGIELEGPRNLDGNDFELMKRAAVLQHVRGGLVTMSWHMRNPATGGDTWDVGKCNAVATVLPGGDKHEMFMRWMDRACDFLSEMKTADGRLIPILWRPLHEHTGDWFWWCRSECTVEQYNELWRMMYDYMVGVRGLNNLVWVISPSHVYIEDIAERYPGDRYVDVVGIDCYSPTGVSNEEAASVFISEMRTGLDVLNRFCAGHGKVLCVAETGYEGIPDVSWWTSVLDKAIEGYPIAYLLLWRNANEPVRRDFHYFCSWPGCGSEDNFAQWCRSDRIQLLD